MCIYCTSSDCPENVKLMIHKNAQTNRFSVKLVDFECEIRQKCSRQLVIIKKAQRNSIYDAIRFTL